MFYFLTQKTNLVDHYEVFISDVVIEEINQTLDEALKAELLSLVAPFQKLSSKTDEIAQIATEYQARGIIPLRKRADALHLAVATVNNLDILVSWNYEHLVKRRTKLEVNATNLSLGYKVLDIVAPPEL